MTLATLSEVLRPCLADGTAVAGLVVLGWEDARAYVAAAEAAGRPVILQAGPGCRAHTPLAVLGAMFRSLAESAQVPVVAHLDHGQDITVCRQAIECGFSSVMYDGSALSLTANIDKTAEIVAMAQGFGVSVEAELGFVGYRAGAASQPTDPMQAARFVAETAVDALAISVGNTHLMTTSASQIDVGTLSGIEAAVPGVPLVLHGGSGIPAQQRRRLARQTSICKFNIGTELRMAFGASLRDTLAQNPDWFDRIAILAATMPTMQAAAHKAILGLAD